jgi:GNAT superfamily N-acetyltransferase
MTISFNCTTFHHAPPADEGYSFEVLDCHGDAIGNAVIKLMESNQESFWHVRELFIQKDRRGKGYGSALVEHFCQYVWNIHRNPIRVHPAIGMQALESQLCDDNLDTPSQEIHYDSQELAEWYKKRGFSVEDQDGRHLWRCPVSSG